MRTALRLWAAVMLLFLVLVPPGALAQGTSTQVAITSAMPDATLTTVTIYGRNFTRFPGLSASLSGFTAPLAIVSMSDTMVLARLPGGLPPGSYWLSVQTSNPGNSDRIAMTVGMAGLRGSINDLNGLACIWNHSFPSKIVVTTEPVSGAVSLNCMPWPYDAVPMGTYEALPVDAATVRALIDLGVASQNVTVAASCGGNPTINCPGGVPPPTQVHIEEASVAITQVDALNFTYVVEERVATVSPIQFTYLGAACSATIDTSRAGSPTLHMTGGATFDSNPPPDPINRLAMGVGSDFIDEGDVAITGPATCNAPFIANAIAGTITLQVRARLMNRVCGAPGPTLFVGC